MIRHAVLALFVTTCAGAGAAQSTTELAKIVAADASAGDVFGSALDLSGPRLLVAAPGDGALDAGSAYVVRRAGTGWAHEAKLVAGDGSPGDSFGSAVALDGDRALVGAPQDDPFGDDSGSAYVFERGASGWAQTAKLVPLVGAVDDAAGWAVDIEGDTAVLGVPNGGGLLTNEGAVLVFERGPGGWAQTAALVAGDGNIGGAFGISVALDGDRLLVGARGDDAGGFAAGAAYVFERTGPGAPWTRTAKLVAADAQSGDRLGHAVALRGDVAAASARDDDDGGTDAGSLYVFERAGTSWSQAAKLLPGDPDPFLRFGTALALDDVRLVVGAPFDAGVSGSAYVFERGAGGWVQTKKLVGSDAVSASALGCDVTVEGGQVLLGAYGDANGGPDAGAVYVYDGTLTADVSSLSVAAGGVQTLLVDAGLGSGGLVYVVLGSVSGIEPGLALGEDTLPLTVDAYTVFTLAQPNTPPLAGSFGVLDTSGRATATFTLPPGAPASLAGFQVAHAFVLIAVGTGQPSVALVSNPTLVELLP